MNIFLQPYLHKPNEFDVCSSTLIYVVIIRLEPVALLVTLAK
jgi:hypothetical protein